MWRELSILLFITLLLTACNVTTTQDSEVPPTTATSSPSPSSNPIPPEDTNPTESENNTAKIIGQIFYERVNPKHDAYGGSALDYNNITKETAKQILVKAINESGRVIATTSTDDQGKYELVNLPKNNNFQIRAYAQIYKESQWNVKVLDNTRGDALYAIESSFTNIGNKGVIIDLTASVNNQESGPFAILGSMYKAMNLIYLTDNKIQFPELFIYWSINNVPTRGELSDGQIGTSSFQNNPNNEKNNIYILGDKYSDTDEYDNHVIIHEWGHYFEFNFSRADSIGGPHGTGDRLDIRLAFGEGFGNALSAIVTDDPIYFDTYGSSGWNMNIETAKKDTPGWFSEASIQRILYDLYDSNDDDDDQLSLGLKPIYDVLVQKQKNTPAFTSIFSFITALKEMNSAQSDKIDTIVASEGIATITDIYGANREDNVNSNVLPLYQELDIGNSVNTCTTTNYGVSNKLGIHKFIYFNVPSQNTYTIKVIENNARTADPDFLLFKVSPFSEIKSAQAPGTEEIRVSLEQGQYLLNIIDANSKSVACFEVSVN